MTAFQEIWDPWLIGLYMWLAGIAGMSSAAYAIMRWSNKREGLRELALASPAATILALIFITVDLSRPWNVSSAIIFSMLSGSFGILRSWMAAGMVLLILQLLISLALALPYLAPKASKPKWLLGQPKWLLGAAAIVGVLVPMYTGFELSSAPGVPFWGTALMPVLWVISASICVVALLKMSVRAVEVSAFLTRAGLVGLNVVQLIAVLALVGVPLQSGSLAAKISAAALAYGELSAPFWTLVVGLGTLAPLALGFYMIKKENKYIGAAAAVLALIGALALRILVLQAGAFEALPPAS
ncbi:MAG: polysulfide reductase NrfD [Thermoproteus sp.]|nr:polysulfide reductase NrfD [Thermoproteus sp.]